MGITRSCIKEQNELTNSNEKCNYQRDNVECYTSRPWSSNDFLSNELSMSDFNIHWPSAKYQRWVHMLVSTPIIVCLLCRYSMLSCFFFTPVKFPDLGSSWVKISPEKLYCFALLSETFLHQGFCRYYQGTYSSEPDYKTYSVKVITVLDLMYY